MIGKDSIDEIFRQKMRVAVGEITPITTGKFNSSYIVAADKKEYVIRIAPDPESVFLFYERNMMAQEPGIHKLLLDKTDVPLPRIHVYDHNRSIIPRD